jgi:hypothetical protein
MRTIPDTHPALARLRRAALLLAATLGCLAPRAALAQAPEQHHIVFLVDQSGSMWRAHGQDNGWAPNDPDGNRVEAILQTYGELQARLDAQRNTRAAYALHVVEFAGAVRRSAPLRVAHVPGDTAAAARQAADRTALRGLRFPSGLDDGETNPLAGLQEAARLIQGLRAPAGRVHVVLVTDGRPYLDGRSLTPGDPYAGEVRRLARTFTDEGADFEVIGILGPEGRDPYWPEWGSFWSGVATDGRAHAVARAPELSPLVDDLVRRWLHLPQAATARNPFYCPPYLRSVTFTVFKEKLGGRVTLRDALGRELGPGTPGVRIEDERTYTRITVQDPAPGLWELDRTASQVRFEPFYRRVRRIAPQGVAGAGLPVSFRYQVLSDQGTAFAELPDYPIQARLDVGADSAGTGVPLRHDGSGTFTSAQPFAFGAPGPVRVRMVGTTRLPDGRAVEVFASEETVDVSRRTLVVLSGGESLPGAASTRFGRLSLRPRLTPRQAAGAGRPLPLRTVARDPRALADVRLVRAGGEAAPGAGGWHPLRPGEGDALRADAPLRLPLLSVSWLLRRPSRLYAEVRVDTAALAPDYAVAGVSRADSSVAAEPEDLPALADNPLAVPLVVREGVATWLLGMVAVVAGLAAALALLGNAGLLAGYAAADELRRQTVTVVIQAAGGGELAEVRKNMTGRRALRLSRGRVGVSIGDDPDAPEWRPQWLKIRRLFRPWSRQVKVRLTYPVGSGRTARRFSTTLVEGARGPVPLNGMRRAEAYLEVRRRGQARVSGAPAWAP